MRSLFSLAATASFVTVLLASCDGGTGPDDADDPCSVTGTFEVTGSRRASGTLRYGFYVSSSLSGSVMGLEPKFGADTTTAYPTFFLIRDDPAGFAIGTYEIGKADETTPSTTFIAQAIFYFKDGTPEVTYESTAGTLVIDRWVGSRVGGRLNFEAEGDVHFAAEFLIPHASPICR